MTANKPTARATSDFFIAGKKKVSHWRAFETRLTVGGTPTLWKKAFTDYFHARLSSRYLKPLKTLQESGLMRGEGFSIVAIQCSLIGFLESTIQGKSYRYRRNTDPPLGQYEYSNSSGMFESFLMNRPPFDGEFITQLLAPDFYASVRCGVLHEARTKNGWTILAKSKTGQLIDANLKIVYRDNFQSWLLKFMKWHKAELPLGGNLQEAFLREFDSLCL
jgi:hypothetical protein